MEALKDMKYESVIDRYYTKYYKPIDPAAVAAIAGKTTEENYENLD